MYGKGVLFSRVVSSSVLSRRTKKDSSSSKKLLEFLAAMPKAHSSRIAEAQQQRHLISRKADKYGPSTVYLQVLGSGANGAPNTLYMFTDQKRYLFNCGECTQRLAHEHKVKLSRLSHIFITSKTWRNIGGLPGLSLTLQDVGVPDIVLHGPDGLDELYNATKRFVIMKDMNVTMARCSPAEDFQDSVMTVKYVLLGPFDAMTIQDLLNDQSKEKEVKKAKPEQVDSDLEQFIQDNTDYYKHRTKRPKTLTRSTVSKGTENKVTDKVDWMFHALQKKFTCSVAYICTLKKRLGTLILERCVELGVKPGPLLGQLKMGHDVVLPSGSVVRAKDVKTPDDPGPVFIVLDVPDVTYLKEEDFAAHFDDPDNPPENIPALIVHFTPPHVFHHPQYRAFMSRFGARTRHLILNAQNSCLGSEAVHRTQHKLHLLDPDIFPLLKDVSVPCEWNAHPPVPKTDSPLRLKGFAELRERIALAQFQNIVNKEGSMHSGDGAGEDEDKLEVTAGRTLTMFHLRPKKQLDRSQEPKLHIQDYIQETMDVDGFVGSLEQFRGVVERARYRQGVSQGTQYPKVVFLGTGSCIPSKTRNTSAIVLRVDEDKSILLDCGEGTFGQLVRFYGPKRVDGFLRTLRGIYVSHLHADHHIGLIGVLQARRQALLQLDPGREPEPLVLMAPGQILSWLSLYDQQFEKTLRDFTLVPNQNLRIYPPRDDEVSPQPALSPAALSQLGVESVATCQVSHCPNAFGVAITVQGHKITYSGDTIPCKTLVQLGENSHLLIHEATMEDELVQEARTKMHSTATQAIEVGRQMAAKYTVLTHFSQRYARLPRLNANILLDNNSVGIAFDNMQITMSDLELLPHMYAPLQLMFADHCVEMELKAANRARQKERQQEASSPEPPGRGARAASCRSAPSRPLAPRGSLARYRESHASRLRQATKGMPVPGLVRPLPTASARPSATSQREARQRAFICNRMAPETTAFKPAPAPEMSHQMNPKDRFFFISGQCNFVGMSSDQTDRPMENQADCNTPSPVLTASETSNSIASYKTRRVDSTHSNRTEVISAVSSKTRRLGVSNSMDKRVGFKGNNLRQDKARIDAVFSHLRQKAAPSLGQQDQTITRGVLWGSQPSSGQDKCSVRPLPWMPRDRPWTANPIKSGDTNKISWNSSTNLNSLSRASSPERVIKSLKTASKIEPTSRVSTARLTKPSSGITHTKPTDSADAPRNIDSGQKDEQPEKTMTTFRETLNETIKREAKKDPPPYKTCSRPGSATHSIRSFKPQLEDIKSSYLLLSKDKKECNETPQSPPAKKPKQVDESERRTQLLEARKRLTSKGYFMQSKYEKIEGLNWISWN